MKYKRKLKTLFKNIPISVGLIHANHTGNGKAIEFLVEQLEAANTPALRHGACLGLGLAACGTQDEKIYAKLRDALFLDEAVTGEAAGIAMGMVMAASLNETAFQVWIN